MVKPKIGKRHNTFNQRWRWTNADRELILSALNGALKPIVHVCSGSSSIGDIRIDICSVDMNSWNKIDKRIYGSPNIIADMSHLPIQSGTANTVICDPPYDYNFLDKKGYDDLIFELVRILKPRGKLLFFAPWVYTHPTLKLVKITPAVVGKRYYMKMLSESFKANGQLEDYI